MPTTIQVSERTKRELVKFVSELQLKLGRRVSFDEAILTLLKGKRRSSRAKRELRSFRGILAGKEREVRKLLEDLRREEETRLEMLGTTE